MVKPLHISTFKMNLFLKWQIQKKFMKNCEVSYYFKRYFCEINLW